MEQSTEDITSNLVRYLRIMLDERKMIARMCCKEDDLRGVKDAKAAMAIIQVIKNEVESGEWTKRL